MITEKEIEEARLSPTKKDYYQIWNELMEMTTKLSNLWNPGMTNESDPGVVLLKVLTGVGDKLSYNIDKATLEHFLPSATQVESVRALCETLGYGMKYYRGATCDVNISFNSSSSVDFNKDLPDGVWFPKFTNIKNIDMDVNYVTLDEFTLSLAESRSIPCMEGALVECISDNDNIITLAQLDTQNRFIFPESNVAENGIFVTNIVNGGESSPWEQVDNLNARIMGSKVYKFGYDSKRHLPYIQFTDEISNLIEDGLKISYIRTNGYAGNVSANTLTVLEPPAIWATSNDPVINKLTAEDFVVSNYAASLNGQDPETIDSAYINFKKTVGTFDTLVACRDYIAAIYKMTINEYNPTPLVSAINVTDIRDDINSAMPLCSFSEYGIKYSDRSVQHYEVLAKTNEKKVWADLYNKFGTLYKYVIPTDDTTPYYAPIVEADFNDEDEIEIFRSCSAIDRFDLILYPFYTIYNVNNKTEFDKSFKFGTEYSSEIIANLGENKTLAHNIKFGNYANGNIAAIKNYVRLHCKVTTVRRVTPAEERELLDNIHKALYKNFNARQVDFGEEIPYDLLVKVIKEADARIKDIMLDDPTMITKILSTDNQEYALAAADATSLSQDAKVANALFNRLALRNVLAGKIAAFDYNTDFVSSYTETKYGDYATSYPVKSGDSTPIITSIESNFTLPAQDTEYELEKNEVIRFTLPNFKTTKIFPAYVNYYFYKNTDNNSSEARPAKMESILDYLSETNKTDATASIAAWTKRADDFMASMLANECLEPIAEWNVTKEDDVISALDKVLAQGEILYIVKTKDQTSSLITKRGGGASDLFTKIDGESKFNKADFVKGSQTPVTIYKLVVENHLSDINKYFIKLEGTDPEITIEGNYANSRGLYVRKSQKIGATAGYLIDKDGWKYARCTAKVSSASQYTQYFVPMTISINGHTYNGLGKDPIYRGEANNTDYLLNDGDYLLINYTSSTTDADGNETKHVHNEVYESTTNKPVYIKANFELIDSREYHQTHSYSKEDKNGQEFNFDINYLGPNEGMFTLGANEQIEIREPVRVELGKLDDPETGETDSGIWNICWSRLDDSLNMLGLSQIEFVYNEWINIENEDRWYESPESLSVDKNGEKVDGKLPAYNAYTLKAGEYFYVTDSKKQNLIYYGSGTTIVRHQSTPRLVKLVGDVEPSATDVANYGLAASLPFHTYLLKNPSTDNTTKRSIIIQENQMIVLTEGDKLIGLQTTSSENKTNAPTTIEATLSTNNPIDVYSARYKFAEAEVAENLPKAPEGLHWVGTSTLDININPDKPQKLNYNDKIILNFSDGSSEELKATKDSDDKPIGKLTLYSSYPCVTANSALGTELRDADGNLIDYGLKIRVSKTVPVTIADSALNMNNYSNKWTKINFSNYKELCNSGPTKGTFDLQVGISNNDQFGLIMFYYINKTWTKASETSTSETDTPTVSQCKISATGGKISLMSDNTDNDKTEIELSPGEKGTGKLSVIKVDKTVTKLTVTPDTNFSGILVFGRLDAVRGINPKLDYRAVSEDTALDQLLADIKRTGLADEFYYNVPVEHAQAIDLNANIDDEKLSSPATWYDNNNVNKKFVISEIDTNYLSTGITLTKQSKG